MMVIHQERPQVVAWHRGVGAGPTLILNAHMDTVDAGEREAWNTLPYVVTCKGKRLYGRGTCDMKGSLAIGMAILKSLHDAGARFAGTLMLQAPLDSPLVGALRENVARVGGVTPEIWAVPYGCDVRNFIYDAGIPAVNFGAGDYRVCHQPNEFVEVDELMTCARVVMGTVVDLLDVERAA